MLSRPVIEASPAEPGVLVLWSGKELVFVGRSDNIRKSLLCAERGNAASHYSWEFTDEIGERVRELLADYMEKTGTTPRFNLSGQA